MARIEHVFLDRLLYQVFGGIGLILGGFYYLSSNQTQVGWILVAVGIAVFATGWKSVKNPKLAIRYRLNPGAVVLEMVHEWKPQTHKLESE